MIWLILGGIPLAAMLIAILAGLFAIISKDFPQAFIWMIVMPLLLVVASLAVLYGLGELGWIASLTREAK